MMKRLATLMLCLVLFAAPISAQEVQQIIEHLGDRYVINVDAMKPDKEMTLMDVLQTCPELMSDNGKQLHSDYEIRVDNVALVMDYETVLEALKASDINTIDVYLTSAVSTGGSGHDGIIDIYLKEQPDGSTLGRLQLEGSTRGCGNAFAHIATKAGNVTVRGYALTNLKYGRGTPTDYEGLSARRGLENVHLDIDWKLSERDDLKIKLTQNFQDDKLRITGDDAMEIAELQRYWGGVAQYTRTLNDQGATVMVEGGVNYLKTNVDDVKQQECLAYYYTEASIPCLNNALNILAGWEIDYDNLLTTRYDRQQMLFNDLYLQFDYTKGPWVLTLGDRFRIVNYWHRFYDSSDNSLFGKNRTENSYLLSAGHKTGGHFVQGMFSHDYFTPLINNYLTYDDDMNRLYHSDIRTHMVYQAEARYTYQQGDLAVSASVIHSWSDNAILADEQYTGIRASATWRKGCLRLTAGADFYHGHVKGSENDIDRSDNFFNLRLLPTLMLGDGLRISSHLFYNSQQHLLFDLPAHLYASVKVSKDLGRHCTISADFHDLAGTPEMTLLQASRAYDNRAVTFGFIYRF